MQHRLLGLLPRNSNSDSPRESADRFRARGEKQACGATKWWLALLITNMTWFCLLVYVIRCSVSSSPQARDASTMSLGQESSWLRRTSICAKLNVRDEHWAGDLREFEGAWNRLCFGPLPRHLRIAGFVKKWPVESAPGGMERHARIVYRDLASRGHEVHIFTVNANRENITDHTENSLHVHLLPAPPAGALYSEDVWEMFLTINASHPFDIVHTESKALPPWKARGIVTPTVATWHGIAAEAIQSDIASERNRLPAEPRSAELQKNLHGRLNDVVEETKVFSSYDHHIAISDFVADVLRTVYEFPVHHVHTIFNGVGETFHPDIAIGATFQQRHKIPKTATLIFGTGGRLVKDKGHPLLFEAFTLIMQQHPSVYLLVAGSGPWEKRYAKLAPNVITLGPLPPSELNGLYNAIDVFIDPTLRSMGMDTTLLEALQCGKHLLATRFSSITWSVIFNNAMGSTFAPNVEAMVAALEEVIREGREKLAKSAGVRREYAQLMFRAEQMGAAYERLFLCLVDESYCKYPLGSDCAPGDNIAAESVLDVSSGRVW